MATRTVTGSWRSFDSSGTRVSRAGTVTFEPSTLVRDSISNEIIVQDPVVATLDSNGNISVQLQVTDESNLNPIGWFWNVTERITGLTARRYQMLLPGSFDPFDLSDVEMPYTSVEMDPDEVYIRGFEALHTVLNPDQAPSLSYEIVNSVGIVNFQLPRAPDFSVGNVDAGSGPDDAAVLDTGENGDILLNFTLPRALFSIGTVVPGNTSYDASVTATDENGEIQLDFVLPRGLAATVDLGSVSVVTPSQPPNVVNSGTPSDAVFDFSLPRSPSFSVGNVVTLDPGLPASVINTGTDGDIVLNFAIPEGQDGSGTAYYGQMYSQTTQTVSINSSGTYEEMSISGVFDSSNSFGTIAPTSATFGIKNDSNYTQLFTVVATADVQVGNNKTAGFRLAKNGIQLSETTCTATTGTSNFAKLMTQWFVELEDGDEISLFVANLTNSDDIIVNRSKIIAFTSGRQGETGPAGPGIAAGGAAGQVLVKVDSADYNTQWSDPAASVSALTDVDLTGIQNNYVLVYDDVAGTWFAEKAAAGAKGGSDANEVFWENDTNVTVSYSITSGKNAMTAGPITIDPGVTVTIPSGSEWTIV